MRRQNCFKTIVMIMAIVFTTSCKKSDCPVNPVPNPNGNKYQRIIDRFMEAGATGVSVTVISPQGIWNGVGGMADVQNKIAMRPENTLRIGSITKMFTMATILKLQEDGVLNIKDKISKYVPGNITDHIANANEATIEQCLNHTAGILEYLTDETVRTGILNGTSIKSPPERYLQFIYDKPASFPTGQGSSYSNSNYLLLSLVIRYVTGKPAYQVVTEKIINPLHLRSTFASTIIPATLTKCYLREKDKTGDLLEVTRLDNDAVGGEGALDGGMISNSQDVATFLEALLTGKILSQPSINMMETFKPKPIDPSDLFDNPDLAYYKEYGLGLMKLLTDQGQAMGHDGHVYGFIGKAFYLPEQKVTMVILLNYFSPDPNSKVMKILNVKETFNLLF
ncbi:serine hydrolase domain-containing protein [Pedobacter cryoconitis]|uniref:D-alanyl-D-alanine carboxypeptidase n=1 Tax=Pedobacter cryoconitis TaxID=188932 RepID=A0A7X0J380_9SPHI|nr:serine hydrolase domain-containing protein [Pedobacter cryoconitis]MBB6499854.1 D-alanyl-D-alanine carboxypeptidase [Pedobacter cryoconitis]